jgi:hypothetical protein
VVDERVDLEAVRRQVLAGEPADQRPFFVAATSDRRSFGGTSVQPIAADYSVTKSGLLVPQAALREATPLDLVRTFVTSVEILGISPGMDVVASAVSAHSL